MTDQPSQKALAVMGERVTLTDMSHAFAASGYFDDVRKVSQAMVKILAGRELGLGPMASINGLHFIDGSLSPGANVMATLIKDSHLHDYKILELTNERCSIRFYERTDTDGEFLEMTPDVTFTMDDAATAKLIRPRSGWEKHPPNMLFARTMSNGFKWHTPHLAKGNALYDRDEFAGVEPWEETEVEQADVDSLPSLNMEEIDSMDSNLEAEDPDVSGDDEPMEQGVTSAGGERLENQWEPEILSKAVDLQLARAAPHAVNILNKSPFQNVPYMELSMEHGIAWFFCWLAIGSGQPELEKDEKRAAALTSWGTKEDREGYKTLAIDALGG